jgi:hypothetical protein
MDNEGSGGWNRRSFLTGGIAAAAVAAPLFSIAQEATNDPPDTSIANRLGALTNELQQVQGRLFSIDAEIVDQPDTRVIDELGTLAGAAAGIATFAQDMIRRRSSS